MRLGVRHSLWTIGVIALGPRCGWEAETGVTSLNLSLVIYNAESYAPAAVVI